MTDGRNTSWWHSALTLAERAATRREATRGDIGEDTSGVGASSDPSVAARRLGRWRAQRPFDRPEVLTRRLRSNALTDAEFLNLLGETPNAAPTSGGEPAWLAALERTREFAAAAARLRATAPAAAAAPDPGGVAPARAFVEPFVAAALSRLFARARSIRAACPDAPFDPEHATRLFEPALWNQLLGRAIKVVVLELNVARVQGTLAGDTSETRYADFVEQLRSGELRQRIIEEYSVLARSLVTASEFWERAAAEFLDHLATDAHRLCDAFAPGHELGVVTSLDVGAGDVHRHGRSVIVVGFSSGLRLVYKPRSLAVDRHFEELVDWMNARGQSPPLRAVRTVGVGGHGWAEFAASAPCGTPTEVARFYERFGAYLALLHALEATDFHYENVIASGDHPMLVDLEALFHPLPHMPNALDEPEWLGWTALQNSVLRAGVLPFRTIASEGAQGLDMSAVGGGGGQRSPGRHPVLAGAGTDRMHLVRDYVRLPESRNRPALGGRAVDPAAYADRILLGFTATYRLLVRHRDALLAPDGPLRRFRDDAIRIVLRPTRQYAVLLGESYHPDVLRDALERDRLIDRLWVAVPTREELERVIAWEHADVVDGDVPLFTSRPGSHDLFTTHGARVERFFEGCGLDTAIARIESMGEDDLLRQQWVVKASLVALLPGGHEGAAPGAAPGAASTHAAATAAPAPAPTSDECIDAARGIARRLATLALRRGEHASWLGLTLLRDRDWTIQPVGTDLYGGTLGIAFFLAHLARIANDDESEQLARSVVTQVVRRARATLSLPGTSGGTLAPGSLGVFGVLGSAVYALPHLAVLWNDPELVDIADAVVEQLAGGVAEDRHLDVIGGVAGLVTAAAALERARPGGPARHMLRAGADRLLACATPAGPGIAWMTTLPARQPLTGLSHGASGMSLALIAAGTTLGDPALIDAAIDALRYERTTFDAERRNWPDYRILGETEPVSPPPSPSPMMWAWCHGAPGIGLARLAALAHTSDAEVAHDLALALESTARNGFGTNDSLCHGDLGNLELLLRARELGFNGPWESCIEAESARLVARIGRGEWRCGIPGGVETPGLMMGLAGIGYGLLRLGAPSQVPSLLSLEPPRAALPGPADR